MSCILDYNATEDFVPRTYEHNGWTQYLHENVPRFGNSNNMFDLVQGDEDQQSEYVQGLYASAAALTALLVYWLLALLFFRFKGPEVFGWLAGRRDPLPAEPRTEAVQEVDETDEIAMLEEESKISTLSVIKTKRQKLGLCLGKTREGAIVVYKIEKHGLFQNSELQVGQRIVAVNDEKCTDDLADTINKIHRCNGAFTIKVCNEINDDDLAVVKWDTVYDKVEYQQRIFRHIIFGCLLIIIVMGIILSAKGVSELSSVVDQGVKTFGLIEDRMGYGIELLEEVSFSLNSARQNGKYLLENINEVCPKQTQEICVDISDPSTCQTNLGIGFVSTMQEAIAFVNSESDQMTAIDTAKEELEVMTSHTYALTDDLMQVHNLLWAVMAISISLSILSVIIVAGLGFNKATVVGAFQRSFVYPLFVIMVLCTFITAICFLMLSLLFADTCYDDPGPKLASIVEDSYVGSSDMVDNIMLRVFEGCQVPAKELQENMGYLKESVEFFESFGAMLEDFEETRVDECGASPWTFPKFDAAISNKVNGQLCEASDHLRDFGDFFTCRFWYPIYYKAVQDSMCTQGTDGLATIATTQIIVVFMALVVMSLRSALWDFQVESHPEDDEKKKALLKGPEPPTSTTSRMTDSTFIDIDLSSSEHETSPLVPDSEEIPRSTEQFSSNYEESKDYEETEEYEYLGALPLSDDIYDASDDESDQGKPENENPLLKLRQMSSERFGAEKMVIFEDSIEDAPIMESTSNAGISEGSNSSLLNADTSIRSEGTFGDDGKTEEEKEKEFESVYMSVSDDLAPLAEALSEDEDSVEDLFIEDSESMGSREHTPKKIESVVNDGIEGPKTTIATSALATVAVGGAIALSPDSSDDDIFVDNEEEAEKGWSDDDSDSTVHMDEQSHEDKDNKEIHAEKFEDQDDDAIVQAANSTSEHQTDELLEAATDKASEETTTIDELIVDSKEELDEQNKIEEPVESPVLSELSKGDQLRATNISTDKSSVDLNLQNSETSTSNEQEEVDESPSLSDISLLNTNAADSELPTAAEEPKDFEAMTENDIEETKADQLTEDEEEKINTVNEKREDTILMVESPIHSPSVEGRKVLNALPFVDDSDSESLPMDEMHADMQGSMRDVSFDNDVQTELDEIAFGAVVMDTPGSTRSLVSREKNFGNATADSSRSLLSHESNFINAVPTESEEEQVQEDQDQERKDTTLQGQAMDTPDIDIQTESKNMALVDELETDFDKSNEEITQKTGVSSSSSSEDDYVTGDWEDVSLNNDETSTEPKVSRPPMIKKQVSVTLGEEMDGGIEILDFQFD